jgi:hypothetical protein
MASIACRRCRIEHAAAWVWRLLARVAKFGCLAAGALVCVAVALGGLAFTPWAAHLGGPDYVDAPWVMIIAAEWLVKTAIAVVEGVRGVGVLVLAALAALLVALRFARRARVRPTNSPYRTVPATSCPSCESGLDAVVSWRSIAAARWGCVPRRINLRADRPRLGGTRSSVPGTGRE